MSNDEITQPSAVEVLRRAIELDGLPGEEFGEITLDSKALAEIAADLGVTSTALAAAIADGQAGVLSKKTFIDRLVGPRWVWSSRTVTAADDVARERLMEWLSVAHGLRPRVRPDGVIVARKRRDVAGKLGSKVRQIQGLGDLGKVNRVQAAAVGTEEYGSQLSERGASGQEAPSGQELPSGQKAPAGQEAPSHEEHSVLCLAVEVSSKRNEAIAGGSAAAVGVSAVIAVASFTAGPLVLVSLPVAAGVGTAVARRTHRTTVARIAESVDHTVDGVVMGEAPPRPLDGITRRLKSSN